MLLLWHVFTLKVIEMSLMFGNKQAVIRDIEFQDTGMMLKNPKQNSNSALVKKRMAAKMKNQSPIQEESIVENEEGTHL